MNAGIFAPVFLAFVLGLISSFGSISGSSVARNQGAEAENSIVAKIDVGRHTETEDPAVTKLRAYLRIDTSHPNPQYERAVKWLRRQAKYFGLKFNYVNFTDPDLFAVWLTWKGTDPSLESILLNSHMDVVTADPAKWKYPPFDAHKDPKGNIYARGATDMKSKTIAQLEAIRRLQADGFEPLRTVVVSVIPDEEIGGEHGMKAFVNSEQFRALNVGLDMDEGGGMWTAKNGTKYWSLSIGNKSAWQFNITARGVTGHGASLGMKGTAGEKMQKVIDRMSKLKHVELAKLGQPGFESAADITTVNLVGLGGGIANNVLPDLLWAMYDMRIRVRPGVGAEGGWGFSDYEAYLNETCSEAGSGVSYEFFQKGVFAHETVANDSNVWWRAVEGVCAEMNWICLPSVLTPTSDAGWVRNAGISAFGYSVSVGDTKYGAKPPLGGPHADNEGINEKDFLASIDEHMKVIRSLSMFRV